MSENIGVTDWFTKVRTDVVYGYESDANIDSLIGEITSAFASKNRSTAADRIGDVLEKNDFLQSVCSDTRLPVCSLYHHLRNTAAIAVCLLADKLLDDEKFISVSLSEYGLSPDQISQYRKEDLTGLVRIASLLHDFGKVRTFSSERKNVKFYEHVSLTEEIIREILSGLNLLLSPGLVLILFFHLLQESIIGKRQVPGLRGLSILVMLSLLLQIAGTRLLERLKGVNWLLPLRTGFFLMRLTVMTGIMHVL